MIKLEHANLIYPKAQAPAVDDLSIGVSEGETCVLIGPPGCGKTTTLRMVDRLNKPTSGGSARMKSWDGFGIDNKLRQYQLMKKNELCQ